MAKQYSMGQGCLIMIGAVFVGAIILGGTNMASTPTSAPPPPPPMTASEAAATAKFGAAPVGSPWDGTYSVVDSYLDKVLKDPDSLKVVGCTVVSIAANGWRVGCDYRAKNSFGGMVRESQWFFIDHGIVVATKKAGGFNF